MGTFRFFYRFELHGQPIRSSCIVVAEDINKAEKAVSEQVAKAGTDAKDFEIINFETVRPGMVVWNL
jgi:hypothetical protein